MTEAGCSSQMSSVFVSLGQMDVNECGEDPGERYAEVCIDQCLPFEDGSIMIWSEITAEARTELVFKENGSLTADRYITEVLEDHVMPFMLDEVEITRFDWPAMNPIERVWDNKSEDIQQLQELPQELRRLLLQE